MAKRASKDDFNMSAEIRTLLTETPTMKGKEVIDAIQRKYPKQTINKNSASVAFAKARQQLGLRGPRKVTRRRRPVGSTTTARAAAATTSESSSAVNIEVLQAAKNLLQKCSGDASVATSALKSVASLQMS